MSDFHVRTGMASDLVFVKDAWLESARDLIPHKFVDEQIYRRRQSKHIADCLQSCQLLVACDALEPNVIWGWIAFDGDIVHYAYVKQIFRRCGILKTLLDTSVPNDFYVFKQLPNQTILTHITKDRECAYDPY